MGFDTSTLSSGFTANKSSIMLRHYDKKNDELLHSLALLDCLSNISMVPAEHKNK